ncbi:hypothetical protein B5G38_11560 [Gemmiger sp. An87]|uniref:fumarylacetoacetate hydrolase family protein n=1 Tax=Allofournierella sp. CML151 TaxID=2998082 RepID=UPI000B380B6C|nr:fumarylacetoacetate hydrolase family protein [Fournierella sp. CML151]OUN15234.1 hypothetical protein B5G38_11560 [Gemmiger sp. An87]
MRFVRFVHPETGRAQAGVLGPGGQVAALASIPGCKPAQDVLEVVRGFSPQQQAAAETYAQTGQGAWESFWLNQVRLLAPIERPIHDVMCVGVNYRAHYEECAAAVHMEEPEAAVYFSKRCSRMTGPEESVESHAGLDLALDYEVELSVVLGKGGRDIAPQDVENHIFGYSVFNDISARTLQHSHMQWYRGKSLDGFCAMGPWIVTRDELPMPLNLNVESRLNGEVRQHSNTRAFIRDIPKLISELSQGITLEAGDIIISGTPAGVGMGFDPPRYMKPGDVIECEVEGIGVLRNRIRD